MRDEARISQLSKQMVRLQESMRMEQQRRSSFEGLRQNINQMRDLAQETMRAFSAKFFSEDIQGMLKVIKALREYGHAPVEQERFEKRVDRDSKDEIEDYKLGEAINWLGEMSSRVKESAQIIDEAVTISNEKEGELMELFMSVREEYVKLKEEQ